jgi:autotransporter-associated beta strand protein
MFLHGMQEIARLGWPDKKLGNNLVTSWNTRTLAGAIICLFATVTSVRRSAAADIDSGNTRLSSNLGNGVDPNFTGGTLQLNSTPTVTQDFTVGNYATNTIDLYGTGTILSGALTGPGPLTFIDSVGNGYVQLTNNGNSYGGTTISSGIVEIGDGGTNGWLAGNVANNGTLEFNRSDSATFNGVITGSGAVTQLGSGTLILTAASSYTGYTTISAGTLALSGSGSLASSAGIVANGAFDISAATAPSIKSLSGTGTVLLGAQTLTITAASGGFSGVISGAGGITLNGGIQLLSGTNTYSGPTIVNGGTLELGAPIVGYNIADSGIVGFLSSGNTVMNGIVSGSGDVSQLGGTTAIATAQTYTGVTTITQGTLALSGSGSISSSRGVIDNATFSVADAAGGASIQSLSGGGTVSLGGQTLTLTNASGLFSGSISGAGGLTLAGGNETLSGTNTYTGPTTVTNGTLLLSGSNSLPASTIIDNAALDISMITNSGTSFTSIASLTGSGSVALGANVLNLMNAADTFSGTISGTGGLQISGGTEILTGISTYTGTTTVSAGVLKLSGNGSLAPTSRLAVNGTLDVSGVSGASLVTFGSLAGTGTVNLGSESLEITNGADAFSGSLVGSGAFIISGGTQVLNGTNTYSGGTTIAAGTLQIGNTSGSGSISGDVLDNGTIAFGQSRASTFSGQISGAGMLIQMGQGTTSLTAANTYTGGTSITAGTLQIGNGGASGSIAGDVMDNGTLAFARSDATTFAGTISGVGGVSAVSGSTALTAVNTYSGATTIGSNAALALGAGGSIAVSNGIIDDGSLDVSSATTAPQIKSLSGGGSVELGAQTLSLTNASGTFTGNTTGAGGLTLVSGTETLSGTNTYTGMTTVNGGTLSIDGSIASSSHVTVMAGGTLGGSGTLPSVVLSDQSTLVPGTNGSGTLHVNGTIAFSNTSNLRLNLSAQSTPAIVTTGPEQLAGSLSISSTDGTYPLAQKIAIMTANGGLSGALVAVPIQSTGAQFSSQLSYDANNAYLEISLAKLSPLLPANATRNQLEVVNGIDTAIASGAVPALGIQNLGNTTSSGLTSAADQMSGEIGADLPLVSQSLANPFTNAIFNHLADRASVLGPGTKKAPSLNDGWTTLFAGSTVYGTDLETGSHKFQSNVVGVAGGTDFQVSSRIRLGGALSIGSSDFHLTDDLGTGKSTAYQAAGYGLIQMTPRLYSAFAVTAALNTMSTSRIVTISGSDTLASNLQTKQIGGRYEAGLDLGWATPYLAVQDQIIDIPGYTEKAVAGTSTFAVLYGAHTVNQGTVELGFRQTGDIIKMKGWTLRAVDRFAWSHDISGAPTADVSLAGLSESDFVVHGAAPGRDAALFSFGTELDNNRGFNIGLRLDSGISSNTQTYNGMADVNVRW